MSESDSTPPARIDVGVAERDLVGGVGDGLGRGGAGPVERVGGDAREELRQQAHLARDVRRAHRGDHLAEDHFVDLAAVELAPIRAARARHAAPAPSRRRRGRPCRSWRTACGGRRRWRPAARAGSRACRLSMKWEKRLDDVAVLFTRDGHHARDCAPALGVDRLEHLAAVQDLERGDQPGQLARAEQVIVRGGAPAELALADQERSPSSAVRRGAPASRTLGHPCTVKIIEHQNRIKTAQLGPWPLEIA